ncbi:MAG: DEAD/DEAH box helicase [Thiotrichales bacterium]|nr:DEAD/DEAH box helicase [Thiotrichales bacterium]
MNSSYFYTQIQENETNRQILNNIKSYAETNKKQTFVVNRPLGDKKYNYNYQDNALILLIPKHKIIFLDLHGNNEDFEEFLDEFVEDLGYISDKFMYKESIGRPKTWKKNITTSIDLTSHNDSIAKIIDQSILTPENQRICELVISLITGSINDIEKIGVETPETLLDKVKSKIILFDGEQTRFIYQENTKKRTSIQGLSGTGKTELLLHKLKELYTTKKDSRIMFTCFNEILASSLRKRIPDFFNFMKVEEQILWHERLWMVRSWGSRNNKNSGTYRYICDYYGIDFNAYNYNMSFDKACSIAITEIKSIFSNEGARQAFDYVLIDESQDFPSSFFELCELVTNNTVYVAGDIFQNIFDANPNNSTNTDFILNRCYRTDPRTLMFAHAVGMGLFEEHKLNWLEDSAWKACGYLINKQDNTYYLSREPIRRFEDLDIEKFESIKLKTIEFESAIDVINNLITIIKDLKNENNTLTPDDIAIIFLNDGKRTYNLIDQTAREIFTEFQWSVNKAYESKSKIPGTLFISNRNNVKGLEFPFVICVSSDLKHDLKYRNALYMSLTRSFLRSYLLLSNRNYIAPIEEGVKEINASGVIKTREPNQAEKDKIKQTIIEFNKEYSMSYREFLYAIFDKLEIKKHSRSKLEKMLDSLELDDKFNESIVIDFINRNIDFI